MTGQAGYNYIRSLYVEAPTFSVRIEIDAQDDDALERAKQWVRAAVRKEVDDGSE